MSTKINEMTDYERRAFVAYIRPGEQDQPGNVTELEHEGLRYVVLNNVNGTLAVYRVTNQGQLRRLRRWPDALDNPPPTSTPELYYGVRKKRKKSKAPTLMDEIMKRAIAKRNAAACDS